MRKVTRTITRDQAKAFQRYYFSKRALLLGKAKRLILIGVLCLIVHVAFSDKLNSLGFLVKLGMLLCSICTARSLFHVHLLDRLYAKISSF